MSTSFHSASSTPASSSRNKNLLAAKSALGLVDVDVVSGGSAVVVGAARRGGGRGDGDDDAGRTDRRPPQRSPRETATTTRYDPSSSSSSSSSRRTTTTKTTKTIAAVPSSNRDGLGGGHGVIAGSGGAPTTSVGRTGGGGKGGGGEGSATSGGGGGGAIVDSDNSPGRRCDVPHRRRLRHFGAPSSSSAITADYSAREDKLTRPMASTTTSSSASTMTSRRRPNHLEASSSSSSSSTTTTPMAYGKAAVGVRSTSSATMGRKIAHDADGGGGSGVGRRNADFDMSKSSTMFNPYVETKRGDVRRRDGREEEEVEAKNRAEWDDPRVRRKRFHDGEYCAVDDGGFGDDLLSYVLGRGEDDVDDDDDHDDQNDASTTDDAEPTSSSDRFDEMRALLMEITPVELEALVVQLFEDDGDDDTESSRLDSFLPARGWKDAEGRSRRNKFRKDVRLSNMSLPEIKRYASDMDLDGIRECTTIDDAIDLIALGFERLVSSSIGRGRISDDAGKDEDDRDGVHERANRDDDDNDDYDDANDKLGGRMQESITSNPASHDSFNNGSDYSELVDGRATLQRSLRACTLPELRLVVERLNLTHLTYNANNKAELIIMIENSMLPDIDALTLPDGTPVHSPPRRLQQMATDEGDDVHMTIDDYSSDDSRGMTNDGYNSKNDLEGSGTDVDYDDSYLDQESDQEEQSNYRKVKFARDTKEDKSHLAPKREKGGGWRSFVTFPNDDAADDNGEGSLPLFDGADDDMDKDGDERRMRYRPSGPLLGEISSLFKRSTSLYRIKPLFSILLLIALIVGISVGLTREKSSENNDSMGVFISDQSLSRTGIPSARPVVSDSPSLSAFGTVMASLSFPTQYPDESSAVMPLASYGGSISTMPLSFSEQITSSPTSSPSIEVIVQTNSPSHGLDGLSDTNSDTTTTNSPTHSTDITTDSTNPVDPLIGPVDESGMRMIIYGPSSFTNMGRTQYTMLTAAYVEQFYNTDQKFDDGVQNIVYDVVANIVIESEELFGAGDSGNSQRSLQEGTANGLMVTFTLTLSYHSLSASIDVSTIANRPFFDEEMRSDYVDFLIAGGAAAHMGTIFSISPVFYGDDIPSTIPVLTALVSSHTPSFASTTASATFSPTQQASDYVETPEPSVVETVPTPSPDLASLGLTTSQPSILSIIPVTSEPSFSTSIQIITSYPITLPPTEFMETSPMPSVGTIPDEPLYDPTLTPTYTVMPTYSPTVEQLTPDLKSNEATTLSTASNVFPYEPTESPTDKPSQLKKRRTQRPSYMPTTDPTFSPTEWCNYPVTDPLCSLLAEDECCQPMCQWDSAVGKCSFSDREISHEIEWNGGFEISQTHVVKAVNEERHAPKVIAHREAELLFTPGISMRRLDSHVDSVELPSQRIESLGTVYLIREGTNEPVLDASAQRLVHSNSVFALPNNISNIEIIVDLKSLRLIDSVSFELHGDTTLVSAQFGLHYDNGGNQEEDESFSPPIRGWVWLEYESESTVEMKGGVSISIPRQKARFVKFRLLGGNSESTSHWGFGRICIRGIKDGLSSNSTPQRNNDGVSMLVRSRPIIDTKTASTDSRSFIPPHSASVRVAVYSPTGKLIGVTYARDPSKQRGILEQKLSSLKIDNYSELIWSTTLPYNWVEEGNVVLIGCIDPNRPTELLVHRLELHNLSEFSEHTITRVKLAIFGTDSQVAMLDSFTHEAKRLARNLFSVMPTAELRWTDTNLWHLPYIVVMGKEGPALVNSEEERRLVCEGTEISWSVLKNYLTLRHSLAETGHGFSATSATAENSPYASSTSVFMGWSLSKQKNYAADEWDWEDLGYWDDLAAAAWTGWCILKAGDECSNYFVHEIGHSMTMEHFDVGAALNWGIEDEYPQDGRYMAHHPWGYDSVTRQFRTWFDPLTGIGKLDPLSGAGQSPTSQQCFSQYTPYQAMKAQEWAANTPILLSSTTSDVPTDGAYKFDPTTHRYSILEGSLLAETVGEAAMPPDEVGIHVITLIGTIGKERLVCQIYPELRSRLGNTFLFPDPFSSRLPQAFNGAAYYVEVRFFDGTSMFGLIAAKNDLDEKSLNFFSFNVAMHRLPTAVALYRFTDSAYPHVSPQSGTELLHLRPISSSLDSVPPLLRVGRGWLGDSKEIIISHFCVSANECDSDRNTVEWRSDVGSDNIVYKSSLTPEPRELVGATVFKIPVERHLDSTQEYSITILITRFYNDGKGLSPLLATDLPQDDGSSDIDATHSIRVMAPWEMNDSLPGGLYRSIPGAALELWAETNGSKTNRRLIHLNISLSLNSKTEAPTSSPTQEGTPLPSLQPVHMLWYIDWKLFTCVTDGESTSWAPAYESKDDCCLSHMAYDVQSCMDK